MRYIICALLATLLPLASPSSFTFHNISFAIGSKKTPNSSQILSQVSGSLKSGRLTAVMGPSGSGKSSLLNALIGRLESPKKNTYTLTGTRYLNDKPLDPTEHLNCAYVKQEDLFFAHQTVRETLMFRVNLKFDPKQLGPAARSDLVNSLLSSLSLEKCADTIVGNARARGISGGEKKRLSIACQLLSSPDIIFMDEPTSGLDSFQAEKLLTTVKKLAVEHDKLVLITIHQPSQLCYDKFDDLLLLANGKLCFMGPAASAQKHLLNIGLVPKSDGMSVAEFLLDAVSMDGEDVEGSISRIDRIAAEAQVTPPPNPLGLTTADHSRRSQRIQFKTATSYVRQFRMLFRRSFKEIMRGKVALTIKVAQQVMTAVVYGGIYSLTDSQSSVFDRYGLLSLIAIGTLNLGMAGTIRAFPKEKALIKDEQSSQLFNTVPYFLAKALSEIPVSAGLSCLFGGLVYPLCGLDPSAVKFTKFLALTTLTSVSSQAVGMAVSSVSKTSDVALALFPPLVVLQIIFDGKNINNENAPRLLSWLPKLSLIRWSWQGFCVNEFEGLRFDTKSERSKGKNAIATGEDALAQMALGGTVMEAAKPLLKILGVCWGVSIGCLSFLGDKYAPMQP